MPDFEASHSLVTDIWKDPATGSRPSRINASSTLAPRFLKVQINTNFTIRCKSLATGLDMTDALNGKFTAWLVESPPSAEYTIDQTSEVGKSGVLICNFKTVGHYTLVIRHEYTPTATNPDAGGAVIMHIDATL